MGLVGGMWTTRWKIFLSCGLDLRTSGPEPRTYVRVMTGQCVCELRMLSLSLSSSARLAISPSAVHAYTNWKFEQNACLVVVLLDLSDSKRNGVTRLQVLICTIEIITQPNGYIFNCCLTFTMMNKLTSWSRWLLFVETFLHTLDPQILSFIRLHVHTSYLLRLTENKYRFLVFPPFSLSSHIHIHTHTHTCNCNFLAEPWCLYTKQALWAVQAKLLEPG